MKLPVISLAMALLAGTACRPEVINDPAPVDTVDLRGRLPGEANATVRHLRIEGGCWVLEQGGQNYQPVNLPASFRVDGLRVRVRFHENRDAASVCMVGPIVTIEAISRA